MEGGKEQSEVRAERGDRVDNRETRLVPKLQAKVLLELQPLPCLPMGVLLFALSPLSTRVATFRRLRWMSGLPLHPKTAVHGCPRVVMRTQDNPRFRHGLSLPTACHIPTPPSSTARPSYS